MSYQVLARKWRPTKFAELVGQDHVKSAIINGLTHQRTHHAYLFTGTRGVGKTTIARIFAKSLNCETGISAEPCGTCSVCLDVDAGRFVDLIEIDAASRTKVGDTREILDNVQYAPTRGRYKIYLIDEVHMLSRHSFNALLKTLEEPPEHVKFLFATTDPQKLPVTILSRCLQFNLQALSISQITAQLQHILTAEQIPFEQPAIELLAKFARGSMRDGLSLTDQAIAQSGQNVTLDVVQQMLGTVDQSWSLQILQAIVSQDSDQLVELFARLQQQQPDFLKILDDLITLTHQVAMCQVVPAAAQLSEANEVMIKKFAGHLSAQQVQVFYQLLIQGKKEMAFAVSPSAGLEMTCLRLLAFSPAAPELRTDEQQKKNLDLARTETPQPEVESGQELGPEEKSNEAEAVITETVSDHVSDSVPEPEPELDSAKQPIVGAEASNTESTDIPAEYAEYESYSQQIESSAHEEPVFNPDLSHDEQLQPAPVTEPEQPAKETNSTVAPSQAAYESDADNPVLAILAARGMSLNASETGQTTQVSSEQAINSPQTGGEDANVQSQSHAQAEQSQIDNEPEETQQEAVEDVELLPVESEQVRYAHQVDKWAAMIEQSGLMGLGRQLALNSEVKIDGDRIELIVREEFAHLLNERSEADLTDVVSRLAPASEFIINKNAVTTMAPADIQQNINMNRQERAEQSIQQDPTVLMLLNEFDAKVIDESIKPL
ncbi:DNA polymerase III subunit gamma/tau [Psychrosphaera ytuae]|uniref:DNA polymerase III subunit gamma/tau n=1 Tax=Psychrosphaera ytuae TaxID=2820710 RepID=A0A975DD47_9GAMM|nr:DNA polymerase III subunit gamma/tau [Psychrosphaera ytuae]QTH64759.1 DNA polymerase III subunit gamma/tau [Psychrosphaera ytuae]